MKRIEINPYKERFVLPPTMAWHLTYLFIDPEMSGDPLSPWSFIRRPYADSVSDGQSVFVSASQTLPKIFHLQHKK